MTLGRYAVGLVIGAACVLLGAVAPTPALNVTVVCAGLFVGRRIMRVDP